MHPVIAMEPPRLANTCCDVTIPLEDVAASMPALRTLLAATRYRGIFMTLPLYVALEKIDKRLIEAAEDLYAGPWRPQGTVAGLAIGGVLGLVVGLVMDYGPFALSIPFGLAGAAIGTWLISQAFIRVTLPLALPGIFAGSLLTFIPAVGDFVNAELLGNPQSLMIGNVIQARYLQVTDYPTASALSFILMLAILIGLFIYARIIGTEELTGASI